MEPCRQTIYQLKNLLEKGEITSAEIVKALLSRIENEEPGINAYITVCRDSALEQAEQADRAMKEGRSPGALAGIPVTIKDNISTKDILTTCGSRILENYIPIFDATVIKKIRQAGGIIIGKTNLDEFAMGSSTETSRFGATRNPADPERIPGGSSGGSAASVACHTAIAALGSDTGGSIRQPAACCGVVGFKPTYGRVSRYGLIAYASSLDQIGPITGNVADCALLLKVISGHDPDDSTSLRAPVPDFEQALKRDIRGLRIGVPREYFGKGLDGEVKSAIFRLMDELEKSGAKRVDLEMPHLEYAVATYYIIATAEASSNLARYDGVKYGYRSIQDDIGDMYRKTRQQGFGAEVKRRIILGTYVLSSGYYDAYYRKAQKVRSRLSLGRWLKIPWPCTFPIFIRFRSIWRACPASACPAAPNRDFRSGSSFSAPVWGRRLF
jgi:aspartyl-tRNA(Asn)/glutamyl-tRNA(Gln) amidotransferase subunit A